MKDNLIRKCRIGFLTTLVTVGIGASAEAATPVFIPEAGKPVHYNWGWGSPKSGFPADNFTAVFNQSGNYASGDYFLQTFADDGVKVEVDGKTLINRWSNYNNQVDQALWLGVKGGQHNVKTHYLENVAAAAVFSDVVPFDSWLAYYYPNENLSGMPTAAKVIKPNGDLKKLYEDFGWGAPTAGVGSDHFSARYSTAKHIQAGEYILRARADDGIRVYVDGKLVVDRWTGSAFREDAIKLSISDLEDAKSGEEDVHWIEVEYFESVAGGKVEFFLEPFQEAIENAWVGEIYPNMFLKGTPFVIGGNRSTRKISEIDFDWGWGLGSPLDMVPGDLFSARFTKKVKMESGNYIFNANGDDGVRVYLDNKLIINTWPNNDLNKKSDVINISGGEHTIRVEYFENVGAAKLSFDYRLMAQMPTQVNKTVHHNWGWGSPKAGIPADYFTGIFDQSGTYSSGDYFLQTFADDGVKVEVDGEWLIDRWTGFTGNTDKALWMGVKAGEHKIKTHYYEGVAAAGVFSDVVPLDSWLAYYYPNESLSGMPTTAKVIKPNGDLKKLYEDFGWGAPAAGIGSDHFSARYTTAKHIKEGEYILRAKADDGIRVYVDGELVVDRWTGGAFREDAVKLSISDREDANPGEEDVHWVEVEYFESVAGGKVEFFLEPFQEAIEDAWVGEIYPNMSLKGNPFIIGGNNSTRKLTNINFDWGWGLGSPLESVPGDRFSARFTKKVNLDVGTYLFNVNGDDGVKVLLDGKEVINAWTNNDLKLKKQAVFVNGGEHTISVEYLENIGHAYVNFDYEKLSTKKIFYQFGDDVQYNWGSGSPSSFPADNFEAIFDQTQSFAGGDHFIQTLADDGVKVTVDDKVKINRWSDSTGKVDQALLLNLTPGEHKIQTNYYEKTGDALIFSNIVPFDSWVAYYYPNNNLSGTPSAAKVIAPTANKTLSEKNSTGSPVNGVIPADNFSAVYRTAKRLNAGEYVIRAKADDGAKVYVDGKLVLDQKAPGDNKEIAKKINIQDQTVSNSAEKNVHWIEVEYFEKGGTSSLDVAIQPINEVMNTDKWVGMLYPNMNLNGYPVILGGLGSQEPLNQLSFNWGNDKPHSLIPADGFSARFVKKAYFNAGVYKINTLSDDGIRVYVDGKLQIDSWVDSTADSKDSPVILDEGVHEIVVEYYDNVFTAELKVDIITVSTNKAKLVSSVKLPAYRSYDELADYGKHLAFYNLSYTRLFELSYGDMIYVLEEKNYAARIQTQDGKIAWVHKDYLETSLMEDLWLVKEGRTLRSSASNTSTNLGFVTAGSKVYLLDHVSVPGSLYTEWYYVQMESGQKGWIWGASNAGGNEGYNLIKYEFNIEATTNQVTVFTPLFSKANITADQINSFINYKTGGNTTVMTNMGYAYLKAQQETGLNAIYLLAHSGLETGWGNSIIVQSKYNFYGIGAIDSKPDEGAYNYATPEGGIIAGASWIKRNYVDRSWDTDASFPYSSKPTIDNMRNDNSWHQYASDEAWAVKIGFFAQEFYTFISK